MYAPMFWDIVGPIALIVFLANLIWSIISFKKKSLLSLFISAAITGGTSLIFLWSIGYYLLVVAVFQLIAAFYTIKKR